MFSTETDCNPKTVARQVQRQQLDAGQIHNERCPPHLENIPASATVSSQTNAFNKLYASMPSNCPSELWIKNHFYANH
jgi:hypothetical protein